jgi:YgiT-type zinc finger domain-containing protein
MQCTVCGAALRPTTSDLPFKVRDHTIVVLKNLPVLECANCMQYLIADREFSRVEQILVRVNGAAELEVIRYVA